MINWERVSNSPWWVWLLIAILVICGVVIVVVGLSFNKAIEKDIEWIIENNPLAKAWKGRKK